MHPPAKLILIDGIAGSGKSTFGQRLYRLIRLNGRAADFYHEFHRPHPILNVEADNDSEWVQQSLSRWRGFVDRISGQDGVAILDGALFQCGIGTLLERGADQRAAIEYGQRVVDIIRRLEPAFVYLHQEDVETALREVWEQRPESWTKRVETEFAELPYARGKSLSGLDLYLEFNRTLRKTSDRLFETMTIPSLAIDNTDRDWDACLNTICQSLDLQAVADPFTPQNFCGEYVQAGEGGTCCIAVSGDVLRVEGLFPITKNLLPKDGDTLFVQTWPDELTFTRDATGQVVSFRSTGPWDRLGTGAWIRHRQGPSVSSV